MIMVCEFSFCDRSAALRNVCVEHAIESEDSGEMLCSSCATVFWWKRVRPILNGSEKSRTDRRTA